MAKLRLLGVLAVLGFAFVSVEAVSRMLGGAQIVGLTSTTSAGCSCHTNSTATTLSVTSGTGSFTVDPGSTTSFTVTVSNGAQAAAGTGIAVKTTATGATNAGTLAVATGSGLQVVNSEITHNAPKTMTSGSASFTFSWTAPTTPGTYYIQAAGNAVNDDQTFNGDAWNHMTAQAVTVAGIELTSLDAGGTHCTGTSVNVTWRSFGITNVKIELSSDGGATWPTVITSSTSAGTGGTGSYSWTVPTNQAAGTNYRVRVSDAANSNRNDASSASFTVATAPTITTQPSAQTVCAGDQVTLTVAATGSNLTYQWRKGGTDIAGATSASHQFTSAVGDAGNYDVEVTNACTTVTSNSVALTVNAPPSITTQPSAQSICVGQQASFTVAATGTGLTYQWRKGGVNINGATSATYSIPSVATGDAANYDVVVSGTCSPTRTSNAVALTVRALPAITTQPFPQAVCSGQPATFTVAATGATLTYQWRRNGVNVAGATGATYSIGAATAANAGNYDVVVSGACSPPVTSSQAALTINPSPTITSDPLSQTVCQGGAVTLTVAASGTGVTYQWRLNGQDIPGATTASLTIDNIGLQDLGGYDVVATQGGCFTISGTALLGMRRAASITGQPTDKSGVVGSTIELSVTATGDDLEYQWKKNGTDVANATSATLSLSNVQTSDAGSYTVEVRNACTTLTSSAATVNVLAPGAGAVLSLSPSTVDFGSVRVGVLEEQVLDGILTNAGDSVLTITNAAIGGANAADFTMVPLAVPMSIPPGESRPMTIRFTPSATGARAATVTFSSNSKAAATLALVGQGAVGVLTPRAQSIAFGTVGIGSSVDSTLEVCNNTEVTVTITAIELDEPFSLIPLTLPVTVAPGECVDLGVRFSPTAEESSSGIMTITTDGEPTNVTIAITGTGASIGASPAERSLVASLAAVPNPTTDAVTIAMTLVRPATVDVSIVDARGALVRRFATTEAATEHRLSWDGRTEDGAPLGSGSYRIVARAGGIVTSTPVVIVR